MKKFEGYDIANLYSESDVEVKVIIPILNALGFNNEDIKMRHPVTFNQGRQILTKQCDILLTNNNSNYAVIESKGPQEKITDDVIAQLDSYAFGLSCKYGIVCNGKVFIVRVYLEGNQKEEVYRSYISDLDIDEVSIFISKENKISELEKNVVKQKVINRQAQDFSSLLKQIHRDIRDIDKLDPTGAFDGWSKLLFMKIYEEKWTEKNGVVRFDYSKFLSEKKIGKAESFINDTFMETKKAFPRIFEDTNENIGLSIDAISLILEKLDGQKIMDIPYDIKGQAFEIFLSSTFRGKGLGQFFTPRPVVDMMVSLTNPSYKDTILDPACGTGGFLIRAYNEINKKIDQMSSSELKKMNVTKESLKYCIKANNFYGIDAEPRAAKTAKMNMIMWGDGENVYRGNGLDVKAKNGDYYPFGEGDISLILANPPFGSQEKEKSILKDYELYMGNKSTQKTECLFIEKALKYLQPGGRLAIVLPDAILGSKSLYFVRDLIRDKAYIKAVISLPKHTFSISGVSTINSSVLFLEKKGPVKKDFAYDIFMGVAQNIGYDSAGRPTVKQKQKTDLNTIVDNYYKYINNEFSINSDFYEIDNTSFIINSEALEDRIDSRYYWFNNLLKKKDFDRVPLEKYITTLRKKIDPRDFPEQIFSIVTVSNKYGIFLDEDDPKKYNVPGEEFTQKYKIIYDGNITYNPYRINVGSIGIVDKDNDGNLVSNAYVVFKTKDGLDSRALLSLFKHPFYKLYIDILATGSIRNNFSEDCLKQILIPTTLLTNNNEKIIRQYDCISDLNKRVEETRSELEKSIEPLIQ